VILKEEKIYKSLARVVGTFFLVIAFYNGYMERGMVSFLGGLLVLLLYIVLIWAKKTWWNEIRYFIVSFLIIAVVLLLHHFYDSSNTALLWPLFCILVLISRDYRPLSILIGIVALSAIILIYSASLGTLFTLLGIILIVRSIQIRRAANRLTAVHLKELNQAHEELKTTHAALQEANVHAVRYAALEERTRLAREIHDGLGHQLTSMIVQLQALEIMLVADPQKASNSVRQLIDIARQAMKEVRIAVKDWSNDEMGLGLIALKGLVSQTQGRTSIQITFQQESEVTEWPIEVSIVLYRVLQESLTNVLRHSNATFTFINLKEWDNTVYLTIKDNGSFQEGDHFTPGYGLNGIVQRCQEYGGTCCFSSLEPHGFGLKAIIPIEPLPDSNEKEFEDGSI
jgi:signal transduction histidine kinase